jgi:MerR family transcriptional regulator, light-induced transcriptional regulator
VGRGYYRSLTTIGKKTTMITEQFYNRYFGCLIGGDRACCDGMIRSLLDSESTIRDIHVDIFQRSMYHVGDLWEKNRIPVAVEHMATAITEGLMTLLYPRLFASPRLDKCAVISCVANEYHQIGGKIVADTFEFHGWNAHFIGANTPVQDLIAFIDRKKPDLVGLSLAVYTAVPSLISAMACIRTDFPHLPLIIGGQAFRWGDGNILNTFSDVILMRSIDDLEAFIIRESV